MFLIQNSMLKGNAIIGVIVYNCKRYVFISFESHPAAAADNDDDYPFRVE